MKTILKQIKETLLAVLFMAISSGLMLTLKNIIEL